MKLNVVNIPSPGKLGLNTEDAGVALATEYAKVATNCVVSRDNRLSARNGFDVFSPSIPFIGNVGSCFETINQDGSSEVIFATESNIYSNYPGVTDITGSVVNGNNWQFTLLQDTLFAVQANNTPRAWQKVSNVWTPQIISLPVGGVDGIPSLAAEYPNTCISAFGRVWMADSTTKKTTVWFSEDLNALNFRTTDAGFIDIAESLLGGDNIVALGSIGNRLLVMCTNQILIYLVNPEATPFIELEEVVKGVGCIARDSVVNTGTDLLWLSTQGVVSFGRLDRNNGQLPVGDISANIHSLMQDELSIISDFKTVKACWWPVEKTYLLLLRDNSRIYVFNLRQGTVIITRWEDIKTIRSLLFTKNRQLLFGGTDTFYAYRFYGNTSDSYRMSYYTGYLDLGNPSAFKFLKNISFLVKTSSEQLTVIKWGFDYNDNYLSSAALVEGVGGETAEFGNAQYNIDEYSAGAKLVERRCVASSSGQYLQFGVEAEITGNEFTIYRAELQATAGKSY